MMQICLCLKNMEKSAHRVEMAHIGPLTESSHSVVFRYSESPI